MEDFSVSTYQNTTSREVADPSYSDELTTVYPWIFIQCSLPYRNPQDYVIQRHNGNTSMLITAGGYIDAHGDTHMHLPYGIYPRIILMYLATEAMRTHSPTIELPRSVWGLLRDMGISWPGGARARDIMRQLRAVLAMSCEMTVTHTADDGSAVQKYSKFLIGERGRIHFSLEGEDLHGDYQSTITLSTGFYEYLCSGAMPVMTTRWRDLIQSTHSPLAADIFLWLSSRLPSVQADTRISWDQLAGQFGSQTSTGTKFRQIFREGLSRALSVYPEARVSEAGAGARTGFRGIILHPSPGSDLTGLHWAYRTAPLPPPQDTASERLYRGVDLGQLQQDLTSAGISTGQVSEARLQRAVAVVLSRASSPISTPQRYVTTALITDPTLLEAHTLTAAQIRTTPQDTTAAAEAAVEATPPTGGICQVCQDAYSGAVCPSCAAELISADPIPAETLTTLWQAVQEQLQQAGHTPGSALHERYSAAVQWHRDHQQI
jgi:hypothetical protein gxylN3_00760